MWPTDITPLYTDILWMALAYTIFSISVTRACGKQAAIKPYLYLFLLIGVGIAAISFSSYYVSSFIGLEVKDAVTHHDAGSKLANEIKASGVHSVLNYAKPGNPMFQLILGITYYITGNSQFLISGINGLFALRGCIKLIESAITLTGIQRVHWFHVIWPCMIPSVVFWTGFNTKEAIVFYAAACTLQLLTLERIRSQRFQEMLGNIIGILLGMALRPHMIGAWLLAVMLAALLIRRKVVFAAFCALIAAGGAYLLSYAYGRSIFELFDAYTSTQARLDEGGSAAINVRGTIPFFSGFPLMFLRPYPWEITNAGGWASMIEILVFSAVLGFIAARSIMEQTVLRLMRHPLIAANLIAIMIFMWFFSYTYNIGLLARQRVIAYPAFISIILVTRFLRQASCGQYLNTRIRK